MIVCTCYLKVSGVALFIINASLDPVVQRGFLYTIPLTFTHYGMGCLAMLVVGVLVSLPLVAGYSLENFTCNEERKGKPVDPKIRKHY